MNKVGTFKVESGRLRVSDPCYGKKTWCAGVIPERALLGTWTAYVEMRDEGPGALGGMRVGKLIVEADRVHSAARKVAWSKDIGVDSGQAGIFDNARYGKKLREPVDINSGALLGSGVEPQMSQDFYEACCSVTSREYEVDNPEPKKITLPDGTTWEFRDTRIKTELTGGTIECGAVSSSGLGDGSYVCTYWLTSSGKVCRVEIDFFPPYDEDEEAA